MARSSIGILLALLAGLAVPPVHAAGKVTLESLIKQMTDLRALAEFPDPPYVTRQFSSYDRASESPKSPDGWFANHDRGFMLYDGIVAAKTPYFKAGPQQGRTPDGYFAPGTKVGVVPSHPDHKPKGAYVWAYATAPDGGPIDGQIPQGYTLQSAVKMDPQGHVLAEMEGPGCVVRIWSANPNDAGNVRFYLDGANQPVINAPMQDLLGGKWQTDQQSNVLRPRPRPGLPPAMWTPFADPIAHERSRGWNLYFPIPYAKRCKICVDRPDIYYHVDYRTYPKSTEVETFSLKTLARLEPQVADVVKKLQQGEELIQAEFAQTRPFDKIEPGKNVRLSVDGPAMVSYLTAQVGGAKDKEKALRGLVLVATFDGAAKPQIWCPLGDFFGSAPGFNPYRSLICVVERSRQARAAMMFRSHWKMPFEKQAVFELHNFGQEPVTAGLSVFTSPYQWNERSMHFHAQWRTEAMKTRPFRDWTLCRLQGKGVFVGDTLSILNPVAAWWGEGDEKIYVDGEAFPSFFGTGTEDYFGYAWSDPKPFQHAYHNQTRCDGPGTYGHTSLNRFHVLDNVPFTKSFRFDMEVWHWTPNIEVSYAATSYWYSRPGGTDDFQPAEARVLQTIPSPPPPFKIAAALEGEQLKLLAMSSRFDVDPQLMVEFPDGKWSGNAQLWARPTKQGEWLDLRLPVAADGKYRVFAYLTKAQDYGIIQFHLNGKPLGRPIDCFNFGKVISTGAIELGTVDLKKGSGTLRVEVVGTNAKSVGTRYMWGLDCLVLKPADEP